MWPCLCSDADVFMVAGRGGGKKDGRKLSALEELFDNAASDSEASTFHGFEDAELQDILFSDDDDAVADS